MNQPDNVIAAVTHPDPYPYYANLAAKHGFEFDDESGVWVAASAAAVEETLASSLVRVRPVNEPVPAGLIGNSLLALAGRGPAAGTAAALPELVRQVSRLDPSIQNTRRYVAGDGVIAGRQVRAGDTILIALAAANHDPTAGNGGRNLGFGSGPHRCPGERIALEIATIGVEALLDAQIDLSRLVDHFGYLPSANARIPVFYREEQSV